MKELTPMSRYRHNLRKLKDLVASVYKDKDFTKKDGGYGYNGEIMPVLSDYILCFIPLDRKEDYATFAFSFNYSNKPEELHTVIASIKPENKNPARDKYFSSRSEVTEKQRELNEKIVSSKPFPIADFNVLLREFNKKLEAKDKRSKDSILEMFSEHFIDQKMDINKEVDEQVSLFESNNKEILTEMADKEDLLLSNRSKISTLESKAAGSLKKTNAYKRREQLKAEINALDKEIEDKKNEYYESYGINSLKSENKELKAFLDNARKSMKNKLDAFCEQQNNLLKGRIFKALSKIFN